MNKIYENITNIFERVNALHGGLGDGLDKGDVDRDQLIMGIMVEFEHIDHEKMKKYTVQEIADFLDDKHESFTEEELNALNTAMDISLDHLYEISDYYVRLDKMEKEAESTNTEN